MVDINYEEVMKLIYDKKTEESLPKIACLVYKYQIDINIFIDNVVKERELSYKQKMLLNWKMLTIAQLVIDIVYNNKDLEDMYSNIDIDPKLLHNESQSD